MNNASLVTTLDALKILRILLPDAPSGQAFVQYDISCSTLVYHCASSLHACSCLIPDSQTSSCYQVMHMLQHQHVCMGAVFSMSILQQFMLWVLCALFTQVFALQPINNPFPTASCLYISISACGLCFHMPLVLIMQMCCLDLLV